jgi:hypothetical protein
MCASIARTDRGWHRTPIRHCIPVAPLTAQRRSQRPGMVQKLRHPSRHTVQAGLRAHSI